MTSPDPVPLPLLPVAAIVTTDGTTWSATWVTAHALTVWEEPDVEPDPGELVAELVHPPTTSAPPSATHSSHRREVGECSDSVTWASRPAPRTLPAAAREGWLWIVSHFLTHLSHLAASSGWAEMVRQAD